jgi:undecaprenol kinase
MKKKITKHINSYKYAVIGIKEIFMSQQNFQIEVLIAIIVIVLGAIFKISQIEWIIITFTIFFVLICEGINSAIEEVCNALDKNYNEHIKYAKDVCSGMVLLSATASVIVGIIIFLPYIQKAL